MNEGIGNSDIISWDKRPWFLTIIVAASYPFLLNLFSSLISSYHSSINIIEQSLSAGGAFLIMLIAFSIPALCVFSLMTIRNNIAPKASTLRVLLYMIAAASPLYIISLQIFGYFGLGAWHIWAWPISILLCGILLIQKNGSNSKYRKAFFNYKLFRKIHGISAVLLIFGFIGLHLSNHLFALNSNASHEEIRLLLNGWYQSEFIEPILFTLLTLMAMTGLPMISRYSGTDNDLLRNLQICSGVFMMFFLMAHVNAILSARSVSTETNWIFATGETGLIQGAVMLIPYYILSAVMVIIHASIGFRKILLVRNNDIEKADRIFYTLLSLGTVFIILIAAAVLGVQI